MATVTGTTSYTAAAPAAGTTTVSGSTSYTAVAPPPAGTNIAGTTSYTAVGPVTAPQRVTRLGGAIRSMTRLFKDGAVVTSATFPTDAAGVPSGWSRTVNVGSVDVTSGQLRLTSAATQYGGGPALVWTDQAAMADGDWTGDVGSSLAEQYHCVSVRADTITAGQYPTNGLTLELQPAAGQPFTSHWLFSKTVGGVKTQLDAGDFAMSATVRTNYRIQTIGSAIKLRLWLANTAEPSTWNMEITDSSVVTAGRFAVAVNNGAAASAVMATFDNFGVVPFSAAAGFAPSTAMPTAEPAGSPFTRIWSEDFDGTPYGVGAFQAADVNGIGTILSSSPAYARYGSKLSIYPDDNWDTGHYAKYWASKTLSTRNDVPDTNGVLDGYLHTETVSGVATPMSFWARPLTPNDVDQRLTFGAFEVRMRADSMAGWGGVFLTIAKLWPSKGEDDWPENPFNQPPAGNYHPADPANVFIPVPTGPQFSFQDFHRYRQEWMPGRIRYLMDGVVYLDTTDRVGDTPRQHVYQSGGDGQVPPANSQGHVQIDWWTVAAYTG